MQSADRTEDATPSDGDPLATLPGEPPIGIHATDGPPSWLELRFAGGDQGGTVLGCQDPAVLARAVANALPELPNDGRTSLIQLWGSGHAGAFVSEPAHAEDGRVRIDWKGDDHRPILTQLVSVPDLWAWLVIFAELAARAETGNAGTSGS